MLHRENTGNFISVGKWPPCRANKGITEKIVNNSLYASLEWTLFTP